MRLFSTIEDADLVLVGSQRELPVTAAAFEAALRNRAAVIKELELVDCSTPEDLLVRYLVDQDAIKRFTSGAPFNTDDNMRIEYSAPLNLHRETAESNFLALLESGKVRETVPLDAVEGLSGRIALARAYGRRADWLRALLVLKATEPEYPNNPLVGRLYTRFQDHLKAEMAGEEPEPDDAADLMVVEQAPTQPAEDQPEAQGEASPPTDSEPATESPSATGEDPFAPTTAP